MGMWSLATVGMGLWWTCGDSGTVALRVCGGHVVIDDCGTVVDLWELWDYGIGIVVGVLSVATVGLWWAPVVGVTVGGGWNLRCSIGRCILG